MQDLTERLRDRIVGGLHLGRLHAGDRLASIRVVAEESGEGHRAVLRAYRTLEEEGLVEVRGRSGVYVAPQEGPGGEMLKETARWLLGVLTEGWKRRIAVAELPDLIRRCTRTIRPRCVCLESSEDALTALCSELRDEFGFDTSALDLETLDESAADGDEKAMPDVLRDAHLVVTTSFHAAAGRRLAAGSGLPLIVATVHPDLRAALEQRLRAGRLAVVCADPRFGARIRDIYGGRHGERIEVVGADPEHVRRLDPDEPVLLTRAARQRLGETPLPPAFPHAPTFSPESVRELLNLLIRLNVEAERMRASR